MIASVSGMQIFIVVPAPSFDSTSIVPPIRSTFVLTTSIPTPRPDTLVTCSAVENPGVKRPLPDPFHVQSAPIVRDREDHLPALMEGAHDELPLGGLAAGGALLRALDAVIDGVPDEVGERVPDRFDHGAVQLRLDAVHLEAHLAAAG